MSKIKVSNLEDTINESDLSVITKPKRVRPPRIPVKVVEPPVIERLPEPATQPRQTKQPRMITCGNCGKELLEKTYKYYHQLKCKPSVDQTVTPEIKSKETPRYENNTVEFTYRRRTPHRQDKYASLIAKAFEKQNKISLSFFDSSMQPSL